MFLGKIQTSMQEIEQMEKEMIREIDLQISLDTDKQIKQLRREFNDHLDIADEIWLNEVEHQNNKQLKKLKD